ncbi:MAG: VWA domain-containing protein [Nanoarchaeota archaeon]
MEITFTNPQYLWGFMIVPALIIVHFFTLKYVKGRAIQFANFTALARIAKSPIMTKNVGALIVRIIALSAMLLAVSGTMISYIGQASSSDFILAIDTSSSMLADDFKPSRLDAAKEAALQFINELPPNTKVGVVSFAGTSFVDIEPTEDMAIVSETIRSLDILKVGGTDIGEAVIMSTNLLNNKDNSKVIILLTDGQSNVGVDPAQSIDYANANQATVYTIGVGTKEGGKIENISIPLKLDEDTLIDIAERTNGEYYLAENTDELTTAYRQISSYNMKKISNDLTMPLIVIALLLSIIDWGLINTRYVRVP